MIKRMAILLLAVAAVTVVGSSAQAVLVTNGAATVFDHNFEADTVGAYPPAPLWDAITPPLDPGDVLMVTDSATPGAYEGSNYLQLTRYSKALVAAVFDSQTSGVVSMTAAIYVADDPSITGSFSEYGSIAFYNAESSTFGPGIIFDPNNGSIKAGAGWATTGVSFIPDAWNEVQIDYIPNATTMTLTVNGVSSVENIATAVSSVGSIRFGTGPSGSGATMYVDAVPEPTTMLLLGFGGVATMYRRRK